MGWILAQTWWAFGARIIALAACYGVAGKLGLMFAIPPGYAAAIWPAAGVALVGVLLFGYGVWPAVVLGSFLVNLRLTLESDEFAKPLMSLALPIAIGCGAALQAVVGAFLVRRLVGYPTPLNTEKSVSALLIVAVPVSCWINATISATLLWWTGEILAEEYAFTWWTWWVGDTVGAFVATPLALLWLAYPQSDWPRRPLTVSVPLGLLGALVVILFVYTDRRERESVRNAFNLQAESLTRALETRVENALQALNIMKSDYGNQPDLNRQRQFAKTAQKHLAQREAVNGLSWLPRVTDAGREKFESAGKRVYDPGFVICERDDQGKYQPAGRRPEYFPLLYLQPAPVRPEVFGYDVAFESDRRDVLKQAIHAGEPVAGPPWTLMQDPGRRKYVLLYLAVYGEGAARDELSDRPEAVLGFIVAIVRVDQLVELAWQSFHTEGIQSTLFDETTTSEKQVMYQREQGAASSRGETRGKTPGAYQRATSIDVAGRKWVLEFVQQPGYTTSHRSMQAWTVLASGMLFTGLLGGILLVVTGREALITALVDQRTTELARANAGMMQEITERLRTEDDLRRSREESRRIIETAADAFVGMDANGKITAWNRQAEIAFGWPRADVLGRFFMDLAVPPHEHNTFTINFHLAAEECPGAFRPFELSTLHRDGHAFPVEMTIWPVPSEPTPSFNAFVRDITERKQTEERIRGLLESAPDPMVIVNESGRIDFVNSRVEIVFGYTRAELLGQMIEILVPERHRAAHPGYRATFLANPQSRPMGSGLALFGRRKDGSEFPVEISLSPLQTPEGILVTAAVRDITERKHAEEVLRKSEESLRLSEERLRLLVEGTTGYAIFMLDPDGHVASWNIGAERINNYRAEEIVGRHFACFYPEDDVRAGTPERALAVAQAEGRHESEGWRLRKDGTRIWAHVILTALRDAAGNLRGFSKITRDLTERKQVEAALEESRRLIERIAEMAPNILYVYDLKEQRNIFVNNRVQSILGYSPAETKKPGSTVLVENYHPEDLPKIEWANEQYQVVEDDAVIEMEFRMRHANGEWRWLHTSNTIFGRDADGSPRQILGTMQDVTERKRLEQEVLEIATQEQRRIGQELHDGTGQELTGLCMLVESLADALRESASADEQRARRIAQGLRHALGHVRALSRGLIPVEVDAEGLMAALSELAGRISQLHNIRCVFECVEPVPVEDNYSATQLYRIAQEAITNAIRHGQPTQIRVSLETKGYYLTLKITDDGIGLPEDNADADGMGLRIMRYRAGQIGAQFSVRPGAGRGTVVACTLFRGSFHE